MPSGAVLVGGGAKLTHCADLAKEILGLPVQIGFPQGFGGILDKVDDPSYATVSGLVLWGQQQVNNPNSFGAADNSLSLRAMNMFSKGTGEGVEKMRGWMKKFLP